MNPEPFLEITLVFIGHDICDPLSENLTCLHFLKLCFITFLLSRGKTPGLLKFQPNLASPFGVIAIGSKKRKTICTVPIREKNTGACLINHMSRVNWSKV